MDRTLGSGVRVNTSGCECVDRMLGSGVRVNTSGHHGVSVWTGRWDLAVEDEGRTDKHVWLFLTVRFPAVSLVLHQRSRTYSAQHLDGIKCVLLSEVCIWCGSGFCCQTQAIPLCVFGSQVAERLGNRAGNQKVASLIPGCANEVVSLGKALHPTCLGGMSLYLL